jgi:hypothetical protein
VSEWGAHELAERLGPAAADVAEIVPELRGHLPDLPRPGPGPPEQARFRLVDGVARLLGAKAAEVPLMLVLDDLHRADEPSLRLLGFLAHGLADDRMLVVGTCRELDASTPLPLRDALSELARSQSPKRRILLRGMTPECVGRFVVHACGREPSPALVEALHARTEGNPLFLLELIELLRSRGEPLPDARGAWEVGIPEGIRHVIGSRLSAALSPECRSLLADASVIGREFHVSVLARLCDLGEDEVLARLEEAERTGTVKAVRASPGTLRFAHELLRDTLYDELPSARRVRLHRHVGELLEERCELRPEARAAAAPEKREPVRAEAGAPGARIAELAHHFHEALPGGDATKALRYDTLAGDHAMGVLAFEAAARHYEAALRVLDAVPTLPESSRGGLLLALADARYRSGDPETAGELLWQVVGGARAAGDAELLARAAFRLVEYKIGGNTLTAVPQRVRVLEEACRRLSTDDSALRARLLAALASELFWGEASGRADALLEEAAAIARRLGDPATSWSVHHARRLFRFAPEAGARSRVVDDALGLAEATGDRACEFLARMDFRLCERFERAEPEAIDRELRICGTLAGELRQPAFDWMVLRARAARATWQGRFAEAERLLEEALARGRRADHDQALLSHRAARLALRRMQGRFLECEEELREEGRLPRNRGHKWAALALLYAESGRAALARRELEGLAARELSELRRDSNYAYNLALLAETCARLGDRERAQLLHERLRPFAARYLTIQTLVTAGCASRYLGLLDALLERWDTAAARFEEALEVERRMGALPFEAWTLRDHARMRATRGEPGDRAAARELLASARKIAQEIGLAGVPSSLGALA